VNTEVIVALTALVAVVVGPVVSLHIAKRQFRVSLDIAKQQFSASVLSVNRQEWINTLRDEIAELVTEISRFHYAKHLLEPGSMEGYEWLNEIGKRGAKIQLLINPGEEDHRELVERITKLLLLAGKPKEEGMPSKLSDLSTEIISKSQEILKREWERVKLGE